MAWWNSTKWMMTDARSGCISDYLLMKSGVEWGRCSGWMEEVVGVVTGGSFCLTASTLDLRGRGTAPPPSLRRPRCDQS
ncbi:hypothetical protein E2C01_021364 [Portunus trituberculatus]|uniref:Uncharacterized protein n=1 Tax=Portunus trituberculatus TaxID=210409 RepID=A0A5B7E418_PORTR|nr:hypothetical protein [Portunus trituberculatus]